MATHTCIESAAGGNHAVPYASGVAQDTKINASIACLCRIRWIVTPACQQAVARFMLFTCHPGAEQEQKAGESEKGLGLQKRKVPIRFVLLA